MGQEQCGMEALVNVIDELPEPHRTTLVQILREKAPDLVEALRASTLPNYRQWRAVEDAMSSAMSDHYGPGHQPDETGIAAEDALDAFVLRWPNDHLASAPE